MKLLLDAGNSQIKWGLYDPSSCSWLTQGAVSHQALVTITQEWANWPITEAYAASVLEPAIESLLNQASPVPIEWVKTLAQGFGVKNHYQDPQQMGVDRWLIVVAAHDLYKTDVVVVSAGTALTIELLTAQGDYLGGFILPGYTLMRRSLAQCSRRLDTPPHAEVVTFPRTTAQAIFSGIIAAIVGAIEEARARLARHTGSGVPPILLTGGDAHFIAPWLTQSVKIIDNLVLVGLLKVTSKGHLEKPQFLK